jgi:hypothetical protein
MKRIIIAGVLIVTLTGCATKTVPLTSSVGNAYRGKSITYAIHEVPSFSAMTADKAMFGALGGAAMISKGNKIIRENEVPDPAATIGATLVNDLAIKYGLIIKQPTKRTSSKKTEQVASDYRHADLVLDVQTRGWGFAYFPMDWNNYHIMYTAKLKLIDTKKATELAIGSFAYDSKDNKKHPTYGQLTNNKAERLKQELKKAQTQCIIESRQRIFSAR